VNTLQARILEAQSERGLPRDSCHELPALETGLSPLILAAELEQAASHGRMPFGTEGIIGVGDRHIGGILTGEEGELGTGVGGKALVTVEVIFRDVEQDPDLRPEARGGIQLEAAHFEYQDLG